MTEDEMVGWHHRLDGHEFEQTPGEGEGEGCLVCCSPWGRKESGTTQQLNNNSCWHRERIQTIPSWFELQALLLSPGERKHLWAGLSNRRISAILCPKSKLNVHLSTWSLAVPPPPSSPEDGGKMPIHGVWLIFSVPCFAPGCVAIFSVCPVEIRLSVWTVMAEK